ncbi:MAG: glycerophosphodiester phosphodiesterase [Sphingobacteriales bacterium]|nr:MAG: glycerophosphodiester phosphodiesterase [Sphingobacteriales bacterium]
MKRKREIVELLILIGFVAGCHTAQQLQMNLPAFDKEGHRGSRGLMPENTIPAMIKGLDLGVTTLEMDAVITKDQQVILSHEPFFNHEITTKPDGSFVSEKEEKQLNIYQFSFEETQRFDVGQKLHPRFPKQEKLPATKPLLLHVIDSVEAHCKKNNLPLPFYNIETKTQPATDNTYHPAPEIFVDLLMKVIVVKKIGSRTIIQSFDFRTLQVVHKKYPHIKTAALIEEYDKKPLEEQLKALGFTPSIYSPAYSLVTPALVKQCHERGIKIIPWTVNDKPGIEKLQAMGVDGIITDYPNLF